MDKVLGFSRVEDFIDEDDLVDPNEITLGKTFKVRHAIFRTGEFAHPWYGNISFDKDYLEKVKNNFERGVTPFDIEVNLRHKPMGDTNGAAGWAKELKIRRGKIDTEVGEKKVYFLDSVTEYNSQGMKLLLDKRFKHISAELDDDFTTNEKLDVGIESISDNASIVQTGDEDDDSVIVSHGPTLTGFALTNKPFIPSLGKVIEFSNNRKSQENNAYISDDKGTGISFFSYDTENFDESNSENLKNKKRKTGELNFNRENEENDAAKSVYEVEDTKKFAVTEFQDFDLVDEDWDGDDAVDDIRDFTDSEDEPSDDYNQGFFWYDEENEDNFIAYKLPYTYEQDGELVAVEEGVETAAAVIEGAMGGVDGPTEDEMDDIREHMEKYYDKMDEDKVAPWNQDEEDSQESSREIDNKELKRKESKMNFSKFLSELSDLELDEQIAKLRELNFSDLDDSEEAIAEELLDEKNEKRRKEKQLEKITNQKKSLEKENKKKDERLTELEQEAKEAKELGWQNKVEVFSEKLRNKGHHESVVKECESKLKSLSSDSRDGIKMFSDDKEEEKELDLIEFMDDILSKIPENARLDESEKFEGNKDNEVEQSDEREVHPDSNGDDEEDKEVFDYDVDKNDFDFDVEEAIENYKEKYSEMPPDYVVEGKLINEDGSMDIMG